MRVFIEIREFIEISSVIFPRNRVIFAILQSFHDFRLFFRRADGLHL